MKYKYYLLLILIVLVWGFAWSINKMGLQFVSPIWFSALRLIVGFFCISLIVIFLRKFKLPHPRDFRIILMMGLIQIGLFMTLINLGLLHVAAGRSAVLVYTTPLWVMPLAVLFFNEKLNYLKGIGFCLGMMGVVILFNPYTFVWSDHTALLGNGILLLASLCWAVSILCARNMKWHRTPLELLPWQLLVGTIPVLLIALFEQPHPHIQWNVSFVMMLAYMGIFATAFTYWGTIVLSKELPSITVSLSFLGVPVVGLIFAALLLHEKISFSMVIAMISIIGGLICVAWGGKKKPDIINNMD